jgi:predicted aldo/keto reductase-like oxidoreductase
MEYFTLSNGNKMPMAGIGVFMMSPAEAEAAVESAIKSGVRLIDTANGYMNESGTGRGIKKSGVAREEIFLVTKLWPTVYEKETAIDETLERLGTDYIDLYQIHNPTREDLDRVLAPDGALEALMAAKNAGKIGHIGITLHSVELFRSALELEWVETIMFPYNIVETQGEEFIARCKEKNIGFIGMKPLAGGAIEDANVALRFLAGNPAVSVVIPGMASPSEIAQNAASLSDSRPLSPAEQKKIAEIRNFLGTNFCRRCNYCAPCTAGIQISSVFLLEGYYSRYHLKDWATLRYSKLEKTASDCVDCGLCETRCPYELPIRQMLKKAAEVMGK